MFYVYYQIILLLTQMFKVNEQRQFCSSVRTKRSQSAPLQQTENEGKQYRTLLSILTENINSTVRLHRNCLGDADTHSKIKVSREEQQSVIDQLEKIYAKMEEKMMKEAINRNVFTKKSIDQYTEAYKNGFPERTFPKTPEIGDQQVDNREYLSKQYLSERRQSIVNSTPKRPLSSKETRNTKISLIHQAYNTFHSHLNSQSHKIKTIAAYANQNPEGKIQKDSAIMIQKKLSKIPSRGKKILLNNKNRYDDAQSAKRKEYEQLLFNGEQIMINERKLKEDPRQYEIQSQNSPYSRRQSTKRMLNMKFSQRKSINDLQKMQIQNRIMMINSVLSVNLVQPQGYRPKTRCWQNYFN